MKREGSSQELKQTMEKLIDPANLIFKQGLHFLYVLPHVIILVYRGRKMLVLPKKL